MFNKDFEGNLDSTLINKVAFDGINKRTAEALNEPSYFNLMKIAAKNSDGVIIVGEEMSDEFSTFVKGLKKPVLFNSDQQTFQESYKDFYLRVLK